MSNQVSVSSRELVEQAMAEIETVDLETAKKYHKQNQALFVDLRDIRELSRDGSIPGAFHMPRGMLEFWIDPQSPYYQSIFDKPRKLVFYCSKGWRSALATQTARRMGLNDVCHIEGGFGAWREGGGPVENRE